MIKKDNVENYYKLYKCDLVPKNNTKAVDYYVNCFDRRLMILFNDKDLSEQDLADIYYSLDSSYIDWNEIDTDECCEEYMINNLDTYYENSIVAVIYEDDEDEKESESDYAI